MASKWFTRESDAVSKTAAGFLADFTQGRLKEVSERVSSSFTWMNKHQPPALWGEPQFVSRHTQHVWKQSNLRGVTAVAIKLLGPAVLQKALGSVQLEGRAVFFAELERGGVTFSVGLLVNPVTSKIEQVFDPSPIVDDLQALSQ
jgi:hypothetical protein